MVFTHKEWRSICCKISKINTPDNKSITVKHDVECDASSALALAEIEASFNINAVYYFQFDVFVKNIEIAKKIKNLGHEIGYHYDVLDACLGNLDNAISLFVEHLDFFKTNGFFIEKVCPHGNPALFRNGWSSNKDFFRSLRIKALFPEILDVVVDFDKAYSPSSSYISDAGYEFKLITNVRENDRVDSMDKPINLIEFLSESTSKIVISTHPHRWKSSLLFALIIKIRFLSIRKSYQFIKIVPGMRLLINKFYFLARRF